jgi:Ca2+-binding RTX toxin-like protein
MSINDVLGQLDFYSAASPWNTKPQAPITEMASIDKALISLHLQNLYANSTIARGILETYLSSSLAIRVGDAGSGVAFAVPSQTDNSTGTPIVIDNYIGYNLAAISSIFYFNSKGNFVREQQELTVIHEIIHDRLMIKDPRGTGPSGAVTEADLNSANFDYDGDTLRTQNFVAAQLGLLNNIQRSYNFTALEGDAVAANFDPGFAYTNNEAIDIARYGTTSNDNIDLSNRTDSSRDLLFGLDGDDRINGGKGKDYIYGGDGADTIIGGEDGDLIVGGEGDDIIWGGVFNLDSDSAGEADTVDYSASTSLISVTYTNEASTSLKVDDGLGGKDQLHSIEKIIGTDKADKLKIVGNIAADTKLLFDAAHGQSGAKRDIINGKGLALSAGFTISIAADGTGSIVDNATNGTIDLLNFDTDVIASSGTDTIIDLTAGAKDIAGGLGDDVIDISGSVEDSIILGGSGNDIITGGAGDDLIVGSGSQLYVFHEDDRNLLSGGAGHDYIASRGNRDTINGGDGNDYVKLFSDYGSLQVVRGGAGDDLIVMRGAGIHVINGQHFGSGQTVILGSDDGHDTVLTGNASDLWVTQDGGTASVRAADGITVQLDGLHASEIDIIWDVEPYVSQSVLTYRGNGNLVIKVKSTGASVCIENVTGSIHFDDELNYSFDTLSVAIVDSTGNPIHIPGFAVQYGDTSQYFTSEAAYFAAKAQSQQESTGTPQDDELIGGHGDDDMTGSEGDDTFTGSPGTDSIDGGSGKDALTLRGSRFDYRITSQASAIVVEGLAHDVGVLTLTSVEQIYFASDDVAYSAEDLLGYFGTSGDDTLVGNELDNTFFGGSGNDSIVPGTGYDVIDGGFGSDVVVLDGAAADHFISREPDGSVVVSHLSNGSYKLLWDVESLLFTADELPVLVSSLPMLGTNSDDLIVGTERAEALYGQDGDDEIFGLGGRDYLSGGGGNDVLDGGAGDNALDGGYGDDILVMSDGAGSLDGGEGSDTFVITSASGAPKSFALSDWGNAFDSDALVLPSGNYYFALNGNDIVINGGSIDLTLINQIRGFGVEEVRVGTDLVMSRDDIIAQVPVQQVVGSTFDDYLEGTGVRDSFAGMEGDDVLIESPGDDVYRWNIGDGNDVIMGDGSEDGFNVVTFGENISSTDIFVNFADPWQTDIRLTISMGGSLTLQNVSGTEQSVDLVQFADGSSWSRAALTTMAEENDGGGGVGPIGRTSLQPKRDNRFSVPTSDFFESGFGHARSSSLGDSTDHSFSRNQIDYRYQEAYRLSENSLIANLSTPHWSQASIDAWGNATSLVEHLAVAEVRAAFHTSRDETQWVDNHTSLLMPRLEIMQY